MKKLAILAAAVALALTFSPSHSFGAAARGDRMVGGGWVDNPDLLDPDSVITVRQGIELWCDNPDIHPSNLEITWDGGNYFHLTGLDSAGCDGNDPQVRDDGGMIEGRGEGRCNGVHAFISFAFLGNPNTRTGDMAAVAIEGDDPDVCSLATNMPLPLQGGNFTFIDDPNI